MELSAESLVLIVPFAMPVGSLTPQLTCERVKQNASAASFLKSLDKFSVR
jgi:hypothetical protein